LIDLDMARFSDDVQGYPSPVDLPADSEAEISFNSADELDSDASSDFVGRRKARGSLDPEKQLPKTLPEITVSRPL